MIRAPRALLFDLDGTLVDSAPDLLAALGHVRTRLDLPRVDLTAYRHLVSTGATGLLEHGLDARADLDLEALRAEFLDHYRHNCWRHTRPFAGIEALLADLERSGIPWGIVTNKTEDLARAVVEAAGWTGRCGCLVGGDTIARAKPHPAPVKLALDRLGTAADQAWFVGDDRRDVTAGHAAGTYTLVAAWGYLPPDPDPAGWGADRVVESPRALAACLAGTDGRASA